MILNDDAFARIVAEDVKNRASQTQKSYLRDPEIAPRWKKALMYLLDNVDSQIEDINLQEKNETSKYEGVKGSKKAVFEIAENFETRRSKIKRFRFYVEQRLAEADRIILLAKDETLDQSAESFLRKAIETHHDLMLEYDLEPTSIDEALWASIMGRWDFGNIDPEDFELDEEDF